MAGLLDYIEAPFQSVGGLFGGAQQAPPPAQQAAPQPMLSAAQGGYMPPPVPPKRGAVGDVLDELLFGGAIQHHAANEQARQMAIYQGQRLAQIYQSLPTDEARRAFALDPAGYAKAQEQVVDAAPSHTVLRPGVAPYTAPAAPMSVAGGNSIYDNGAITGTAPLLSMTKDNQGVTQTPFGTFGTGALPTIQKAAPGETISPLAPVGPAASGAPPTPQQVYGPQVGGGAPQGQQQALPRGLRNNNPGNVKALPNGQMWAGQTGTDDQGYAVFADPKAGVHATLTNLDAYATRHGISTPQAIAARWSPGSSGYGQFIAQQLGVKPGDHINLKDPSVQGQVAQAIFKMENGPQAMQARFPAASAPAQPGRSTRPEPQASAQQAPPAPGLPTSIQGRTNALVSPDEAIRLGLAPGRWERDPAGKLVQASPAPKGDTDRVDSLVATTQSLRALVQEQQNFLDHNKKFATGPGYLNPEIHGIGLNPVSGILAHTNDDFKNMEASAGKQLFMVKPENAGARILQSEIPYWEIQTQNPDNTGTANQAILAENQKKLAQAERQSNLYQKYIYEHGNLNGADQAYSAQKDRGASAVPRPPGQNQPPQKARIRTYNPKTGGLE